MTGSWSTVTIDGRDADIYEPEGRARFGIIYLFGYSPEPLIRQPAFSESLVGNGDPIAALPTDPATIRLAVVEVSGGNDPTPAACDAGNGVWNAKRGE